MSATKEPVPIIRVLIALLTIASLTAADWPHWRGPAYDGSSDAVELPERLDDSTRLWSVTLPGFGASTPVVWGERIFLSTLDPDSGDLLALCLRRSDGAILWRNTVGVGFHPQHREDLVGPSATCDGERVVFTFGTGDLAAYAHDGAVMWQRNLQKDFGKFSNQWIYASSPLLLNGRLHIQVLQTNPDAKAPTAQTTSYVLGVNAATGKDLWKHPRPTTARGESQDAYTSPIPVLVDGRQQILIFGGDCLTSHDADSGTELWRFGGWNPTKNSTWRMIPSPVVMGERIVICTARGNRLVAVKSNGAGDISATHQLWDTDAISTDIAIPLAYRGKLFVLHGDKKILARLDPATGAIEWQGEIDSRTVLRGSPTAADGKIYLLNESGDVWVMASDNFRVLSRSALGGEGVSRASIALADHLVLVRAGDHLHAFGKR